MKRFLATVAALAALSLLSACNVTSSSANAATVRSGTTSTVITTGELDSTLAILARDPGYLCIGGLSTAQTAGAGVGTYSVSYADTVLTQLIKFAVTSQIASSLHLAMPSGAAAIASDQVETRTATELTSASSTNHACAESAQTVLAGLGTYYRRALEANQVQEDAIVAHLAGVSLEPAALVGYEQAHTAATLESCTSVIDVGTKKLVDTLHAQIESGASFASVADAHPSQGTGAGGSVGCPLESEWIGGLGTTVGKLKIGQLSAPVAFNGGWILLLVTGRKLESMPDLLTSLATTESAGFQTLTSRALQHAAISVSPVYGSWARKSTSQGIQVGIDPPPDRASKFVPTTAAPSLPAS